MISVNGPASLIAFGTSCVAFGAETGTHPVASAPGSVYSGLIVGMLVYNLIVVLAMKDLIFLLVNLVGLLAGLSLTLHPGPGFALASATLIVLFSASVTENFKKMCGSAPESSGFPSRVFLTARTSSGRESFSAFSSQ